MRKEKLFVVRLWSDSKSSNSWRASLENIRTKECLNFSDLDKLAKHLKAFETSKKRMTR